MLIVFDLDGTLVDSRQDLADSANALLADYDLAPLPDHRIVEMVGDGAATLVQRVCSAAGLRSVPPDALPRFLRLYDARLLNHTRPYPGIREMLQGAAACGPMAVLTNKPDAASRAVLRGTDLLGFFQDLVGGDGPWPRKPDPRGLQWLIDKAGEPSVLLVGDSSVDLQTARAAGVPVCLARYGFGFASIPPEARTSADSVIDRPLDLVDLLARWCFD